MNVSPRTSKRPRFPSHRALRGSLDHYRGSSAIAATCELIFQLGRDESDPDRERKFLRCIKSRPAPEPPKRWIRLSVERGRVLLSETPSPEGSEAAKRGRPRTSDRFIPVILAKLSEGPQTQADLARAIGQQPSSGTARALLDKLQDDREVKRRDDGKWELAKSPTPQGDGTFRNGDSDRATAIEVVRRHAGEDGA